MRITDPRYRRDIARYSLAATMVRLEARTRTIRQWTGVSGRLVRALYDSYLRDEGRTLRHRGPTPRRAAFFLRSAKVRDEAAALVGLCSVLQVIPAQPLDNARRELPGLQRGERLCRVFELFQGLVGSSEFTLDHAILLIVAVAQGTELRLGHCTDCGGAMIFDPEALSRRMCSHCAAEPQVSHEESRAARDGPHSSVPAQQSLF